MSRLEKKPTNSIPPSEPENEATRLARWRKRAHNERVAVYWLWFAVISISLIIATLWGYSLYTQISVLNLKDSKENKLLQAGQKNWEEAFNLTKQREVEQNLAKEKLAIVIQMLKDSTAAPNSTTITSTSSSAPNNATTTTTIE